MRGVVKRFGQVVAVNGLELEVPAGLCYGLLGPNGAGKSTTMRILTGQSLADGGQVEVLGHRLPRESKLARARPRSTSRLLSCGHTPMVMSTHYIEEAERLSDRVAIMSAGRVVAEGTPAELILAHAGREVVDVHGSVAELRHLRERAAASGLPTRRSGPAITYLHADALDGRVPAGARRSANLEDVFVRLTGDYVE